ncbi:MAG: tetratricopeptide repeat protein [Deltaproteobacteria bacterium]
MAEGKKRRKLTAIFSADVKGYSRLMADDEEATVNTINAYRELMTDLIQRHDGRVVDAKGDNVLAEFPSVVDAVRCAARVQKELAERNSELPENRRMEFRIGINLGDVIEEKETIYGDGVNVAARLEGLAEGGGICISGTAFDQVKNRVPMGYEFQGEQSVKNIPDPVRVYKVLLDEGAAGKIIGEEPPKSKRWRWVAAAIAIILVIGVWGFWHFYFRPPPIEPASREKMAYPLPDKPSIAVLPFVNMSGDPEQDYFSDGLTEDIITALSKVPEIFVIARSSTFTYKNKPVKIQKVAEDLGVQYVMEGSVQKTKNRIRITVQLIDALTGYHVWAERYDRQLKDLFALQDKITLEILKAMDIKVARGESLHGRGTSNLEAYFKYLQLRKLIYQFNKASNVKARKLAEEAISLDPKFPAAYYGLAAVTMLDARFGISKSPKKSLKKAIELCQKAVSLDDTLASAYGLLGYLYVQIREYKKGIAEGERAIQRAPNSADAHSMLAQVLNFSGRPQEAIALNEKAFRLNPVAPVTYYYTHAALSYFLTGRYEDAVRMCKEELSRWPNDVFAHWWLAMNYAALGRDKEAQETAQHLLDIDPNFSAKRYARLLPFKNPERNREILKLLLKAGFPEHPPLPLPDKPSIAVLPFVNLSDDPKQGYFVTGAAFCREHQINRSRFYYWRCRFKNNTSIEGIPGGFVELVPYPKKPSAGVHIHIGDGLHIEVERDFDPVTLRVAIQAVQG